MKTPAVRVWEEVSLTALRNNFLAIQKQLPGFRVMTVVKAQAYGLGVHPAAKTFLDAGCAGFCAATWDEARELVPYGLPVQILGGVFDFELPEAVRAGNVILGITDFETAERFSAEAVRQGKTLECHFALDTGMGRLGILYYDAPEVIRRCAALPNLACRGIYSHFPQAYTGPDSFAEIQRKRFLDVLESCAANGIHFDKIHMANSDAVNLFPGVCSAPFNYARAGIDLYGSFTPEGRAIGLVPAIELRTRLVAARILPKGYSVGYERTCILDHDTLVGTVAAGYADGLPLQLSNRGRALYRGVSCPILGRISMDYTAVSLDAFRPGECRMGDVVTLIGRDGDSEIRAEEWAELKKSHVYDILCSIGPRVERVYCS